MYTPSELDLADLRYQMRKMYNDVGSVGSMQCLYEILISANILMDIILEEHKKGNR